MSSLARGPWLARSPRSGPRSTSSIESATLAELCDMQVSVAMGNSSAKLKELADHTTESNDDDGVADVIDKFVLQPAATPVR
jgi:haloacid dehalogenase-like hydrolase